MNRWMLTGAAAMAAGAAVAATAAVLPASAPGRTQLSAQAPVPPGIAAPLVPIDYAQPGPGLNQGHGMSKGLRQALRPVQPSAPAPPSAPAQGCAPGSGPQIVVDGVVFSPPLRGGTTMAVGTYRLRVTGRVLNDSPASIVVRQWRIKLGGAPWRTSQNRFGVGVGAAASFAASGDFVNHRERPAQVTTDLAWDFAQTPACPAAAARQFVGED